jgi:hypothetical protein|tara:strand:- start:96 stop:617 length:522 start_codon:yes stop_codon:yes gene_type:complete
MADKVTFAVSCTPQEELSTENSTTTYVIASEVNKSLGGSGTATCASYAGTAANQGYLNATVNYLEAPDGAGNEVAISSESSASFVFIKNTGHIFSSATVLGDADTSATLKVTTNSGAILISNLAAGEAIVLKGKQSGSGATIVASGIEVETVLSNGAETSGGNHLAVEYLVVD